MSKDKVNWGPLLEDGGGMPEEPTTWHFYHCATFSGGKCNCLPAKVEMNQTIVVIFKDKLDALTAENAQLKAELNSLNERIGKSTNPH